MYQYSKSAKILLPNFKHGWHIIYKHNGEYYTKPRKSYNAFEKLILDGEEFVKIT